ncbi:MAG: WecB/TagA/CpsF family glycosyltransferase [Dethiobacteria bacterium]|jgi:N-acetylglucosaminyldiphosphoundecaprenol N-acetyl-beta-D-mannosaminyltransferase
MSDYAKKFGENNGRKVNILGVPVDRLTLQQAVGQIRRAWNEGRFLHVVTANAEMLYRCRQDRELKEIIKAAELVTADGAGVVLASRILKCAVPERVAGFDLMLACLKEAARTGCPLYFLGSRQSVLEQAAVKARKNYPGLNIVGCHHGFFQESEEEAILEEICSLRPALLLVALGVPKQEKWIARYRKRLPPSAVIGVGGSFDVLAGAARRAPLWMQRAGLEWLYRLWKEPSRLGRTAALPLFLCAVFRQAVQGTGEQ